MLSTLLRTLEVSSSLTSDSMKIRTQGLKSPPMISFSFLSPIYLPFPLPSLFWDRLMVTFQRGLNVLKCVLKIGNGTPDCGLSNDRSLDSSQSCLFRAHRHDEIEAGLL